MVRWGDVPSWLSSPASLPALLFAAIAVAVARRTFRIESERNRIDTQTRRAGEAAARRQQAALVSAWSGRQTPGGQSGVFVRDEDRRVELQSTR